MSTVTAPQVRDLDARDARAFLARHFVGRIAFGQAEGIDIRPVHYVFADGRIYGRTSPQVKVVASEAARWAPVAFEVDEVESLFRWRSVLARGDFHVLDPDGPDAEEWSAAVKLLRRLQPTAFTQQDPVPHRSVVFRIVVRELTGRAMD